MFVYFFFVLQRTQHTQNKANGRRGRIIITNIASYHDDDDDDDDMIRCVCRTQQQQQTLTIPL